MRTINYAEELSLVGCARCHVCGRNENIRRYLILFTLNLARKYNHHRVCFSSAAASTFWLPGQNSATVCSPLEQNKYLRSLRLTIK